MTDKVLYQRVVDEITNGQLDRALWAMVWTNAGGDEKKARAGYVEARIREIRAEQRRASKTANADHRRARRIVNAPERRRIERSWAGLFICALISALVVQAYAGGSQGDIPRLRWSFYIIGTIAYAVGLLGFPSLAILCTRGRKLGFLIAFLILLVTSFLAIYGSLPGYPENRPVLPNYVTTVQTPSLWPVASKEAQPALAPSLKAEVDSSTVTAAQGLAPLPSGMRRSFNYKASDGYVYTLSTDGNLTPRVMSEAEDGLESQLNTRRQQDAQQQAADALAGRLQTYLGVTLRSVAQSFVCDVRGLGEFLEIPALMRGGYALQSCVASKLPVYANDPSS